MSGNFPARLLSAVAVTALVGAACGIDSSPDTTTIPPTTTSSTTTTTTSTTTTTTTTTIPVPQLTLDSHLSTAGLGPVRTWMTVPEAIIAAGMDLVGRPDPTISPNCYYVAPEAEELAGIRFMVFDGRIARVDIGPPSPIETPSGVKIGMTEQEIISMFGERIEESFDYRENGKALVFVPADEQEVENRVVFEIDQGFVTAMRAGRLPAVQFSEGCL